MLVIAVNVMSPSLVQIHLMNPHCDFFRVTLTRELGFLTESGAEAFDQLYSMRKKTLALLQCGAEVAVVTRQLTMKQLLQDLLYLLIGVPSHTFLLNTVSVIHIGVLLHTFLLNTVSVLHIGVLSHSFLLNTVRVNTHMSALTQLLTAYSKCNTHMSALTQLLTEYSECITHRSAFTQLLTEYSAC